MRGPSDSWTVESAFCRRAWRHCALVVFAVAIFPAVPLQAADWPHLRGPNYDGVSAETRLADTWPDTGPPRLWSRELGQGHSGFVVAAGKLYTQRQDSGGQSLLCLDPADGRTLWETHYAAAWQAHGAYPGPYATPTWYRGKVYYASPTGLAEARSMARAGAPPGPWMCASASRAEASTSVTPQRRWWKTALSSCRLAAPTPRSWLWTLTTAADGRPAPTRPAIAPLSRSPGGRRVASPATCRTPS